MEYLKRVLYTNQNEGRSRFSSSSSSLAFCKNKHSRNQLLRHKDRFQFKVFFSIIFVDDDQCDFAKKLMTTQVVRCNYSSLEVLPDHANKLCNLHN